MYSVQAFAARAIGYLVNPFDDDQFRDAMQHAKATHHGSVARERAERLRGLVTALGAYEHRVTARRTRGAAGEFESVHNAGVEPCAPFAI